MKKREISAIKKGFKLENDEILTVEGLVHTYCKMTNEGLEILFSSEGNFNNKEDEVKERYYKNIKKILSGKLNKKLFNLSFSKTDGGKQSQELLYSLLNRELFYDKSIELAKKITENIIYGTDVVITTMLCKSCIYKSRGNEIYHRFMACTINQLQKTETGLTVDVSAKDIIEKNSAILIDMNSPMEGFIYPNLSDMQSDVNSVLYSSLKLNVLHKQMIKCVLSVDKVATSKEEKDLFSNLLKDAVGENADYKTVSKIYKDILEEHEVNEKTELSSKDIVGILENSNVENAEEIVLKYLPKSSNFINIENLVPINKKGLKIKGNEFDISIDCSDISKINKTVSNGKSVLIIELSGSISIDGINIK